jgi:hypothetical protein
MSMILRFFACGPKRMSKKTNTDLEHEEPQDELGHEEHQHELEQEHQHELEYEEPQFELDFKHDASVNASDFKDSKEIDSQLKKIFSLMYKREQLAGFIKFSSEEEKVLICERLMELGLEKEPQTLENFIIVTVTGRTKTKIDFNICLALRNQSPEGDSMTEFGNLRTNFGEVRSDVCWYQGVLNANLGDHPSLAPLPSLWIEVYWENDDADRKRAHRKFRGFLGNNGMPGMVCIGVGLPNSAVFNVPAAVAGPPVQANPTAQQPIVNAGFIIGPDPAPYVYVWNLNTPYHSPNSYPVLRGTFVRVQIPTGNLAAPNWDFDLSCDMIIDQFL